MSVRRAHDEVAHNDYGLVGYGGPCPPPDGQVHHYVFTVYALSVAHIAGTHITIGKFRLPLGS